jgi:hypothetical protein
MESNLDFELGFKVFEFEKMIYLIDIIGFKIWKNPRSNPHP